MTDPTTRPADLEDLLALHHDAFEPWNAWDVDAILSNDAFAGGAQGFGFRTRDARIDVPLDEQREILTAWYASLDRYRIVDTEVHGRIDGDLAVVWGFYTEDFKPKGAPAERVRVRFSNVMHRQDGRWVSYWNHRDAQDFDEHGIYRARPTD